MTVNVTAMLDNSIGKAAAKGIFFKLKEFKKCHWRLFLGPNKMLYLFVCGYDEVTLFVARKDSDKFYPMYDYHNEELWAIIKGDVEYESCKKIVCEEEDWKKEVLLHRKSERKIVRALCKAAALDPMFKELQCNHPTNLGPLASFLSIITGKES